jgi:hypothetical protein
MPKAATKSRYQPHPMLDRERSAQEKLVTETGKTWEQWLRLARTKGPKDRRELAKWLQTEHGHRPMYSQWIAYAAVDPDGGDYGDPETLVDALYSGDREALRPLHEAVVDRLLALGDDVLVTACKTMVPAYRKHVFADLRPVQGGVAIRLALGDVPAKGRLGLASGRVAGDRLLHEVVVRSPKELDRELVGWLQAAYGHGAGKIARAKSAKTPDDLAKALKEKKPAATWATMTPAMQRDMIEWIESAKQQETRARRLATVVAKLTEGKRRVY